MSEGPSPRRGEDAFAGLLGARLPPLWALPLVLAVFFVATGAIMAALGVAISTAGLDVAAAGSDWRLLSVLVVTALLVMAAVSAGWIRWVERRPLASAGLGRFRPAGDLPWFVIGLVFAAAVATGIAYGAGTGSEVDALPGQAAADPGRLLAGAGVLCLILLPNSIVEELLFRGWALSVIGRRLGLPWALAITSAAFGAAHVPPWEWSEPARLLSFVSYSAAGVSFGALALHRRSLYAPIAFHTGFNTLLLTAAYAEARLDPAQLVRDINASPLGTEHLGEATVWLLVEVAFAALLVWWWRRRSSPAPQGRIAKPASG